MTLKYLTQLNKMDKQQIEISQMRKKLHTSQCKGRQNVTLANVLLRLFHVTAQIEELSKQLFKIDLQDLIRNVGRVTVHRTAPHAALIKLFHRSHLATIVLL